VLQENTDETNAILHITCWRLFLRGKTTGRRVGGAEGAPYSGAPYRIEIIRARLFILAPLSGRIFAWRLPRVSTRL